MKVNRLLLTWLSNDSSIYSDCSSFAHMILFKQDGLLIALWFVYSKHRK